MSAIPFLPSARPRLTLALALSRVAVPVNLGEVTVLGFRGYYHVDEDDNERGKYDDAVAIVGPEHWSTYNYNTDPSAHRQGIATLTAGDWRYKPGIHGLSKPKAHQYAAFVQAGPVQVRRDQGATESGYFGINIHRGGATGTSSLGCQTLPPAQWDAFRTTLLDQLRRAGQKTFRYLLTDKPS